jgi:F-type H+-transporting ATPase subunit a
LEATKTRKWRWGVNRWFILGFSILSIIGVNLFAPVRPHIQVAAEKISGVLFTLPIIGDFSITNSMIAMLIGDVIIIALAWAIRQSLKKGSLVPKGISGAMEALLEVIYNMTETSAGKWVKAIFPWFMTIMLVVLVANLVKLLPGVETIGWMEESSKGHAIQQLLPGVSTVVAGSEEGEGFVVVPFVRALSTDLNFTVALALISVFMTQVIGIRAQGLGYFSKFLNFRTLFKKPFFGFMDFAVGVLELISEIAKVLSFSFRLFGNMFAGMVLLALVSTMVPIFVPSTIMMFELFIGLIQAFVFGMLTMVFMAQATRGHGEEHHEN